MVKIATVYFKHTVNGYHAYTMDFVRWLRISEGLAERGYKVDMIINTNRGIELIYPNLRKIPYSEVNWEEYDIIKTLYQEGFESLMEEYKNHPFIISRLGTVAGSREMQGVHFYDAELKKLYETQQKINKKSKFISVLTEENRVLWHKEFGKKKNVLLVPTGVDRRIPLPLKNPYRKFKGKIVVFIGNIYGRMLSGKIWQKHINLMWQHKLNTIGKQLRKKGIHLCFVGFGDTEILDSRYVTCFGPINNRSIWDYQYYADIGLVFAQGEKQNNESSKIYYYLRAGLPVISEQPTPNNYLITESGLGYICEYNNNDMMVALIEKAINKKWDRKNAIDYVLKNHTWDRRIAIYDDIIRKNIFKK